MKKSRNRIACLAATLLFAQCAWAQVPQLINYQGRVTVNGMNFDGTGLFKFALVNATGSTSYWSNDGTGVAGSEPAAAVTLTVTRGLYSVLLGDATLTNMTIVPATVFTNPDVLLRVWFNDGTNGTQLLSPDQRIAAVGYAMMAQNVPDGLITSSKLALGSVGEAQLATGSVHSIHLGNGAVGAEELAEGAAVANLAASGQSGLTSGSLVLAPAENNELINAGYIRIGATSTTDTWQQRTGGSPPRALRDHTAVWTGTEMIVWGGNYNGFVLETDGGRYNPAVNHWRRINANFAPAPREDHTAVWTGSKMIVWGGLDLNTYLGDGASYDPATDLWTAMSTNDAPSPRTGHTAVWTGTEMIIWGGSIYVGPGFFDYDWFNDGARYNPETDLWTPMPTSGAPAARHKHAAVWTGTEMIVWGGDSGGDPGYGGKDDGARYNRMANIWVDIDPVNGIDGRTGHKAVWTGTEMLIHGGISDDFGELAQYLGSYLPSRILRYNPAQNSWTNSSGWLAGRTEHTAIWTGTEMIVWGGQDTITTNLATYYFGTGGRYKPATDTLTATPTNGAPSARTRHTAVWTGTEMIVWGGNDATASLNDGGRFTPGRNTWKLIDSVGAPVGRTLHTTVWTGTEMIIWGGESDGLNFLDDGGRYIPATDSWRTISTNGAHVMNKYHTAVWTGTEMLVWGGYSPLIYLPEGKRYNPVLDAWAPMSSSNAPTARTSHTAVWTGNEMIIWGGWDNGLATTGGSYYPPADSWIQISTNNAPSPRSRHTAVWTGNEMIVFGGEEGVHMLLNTGGRYDPARDEWISLSTASGTPPSERIYHTAIWTGTEMIIWGGSGLLDSWLDDGARFKPASNSWTPMVNTLPNTPGARSLHSAVWTGTEMIIWGGVGDVPFTLGRSDGAAYSPALNNWTTMTEIGAAPPRQLHSAVWTGTEMLVWGGADLNYVRLNDTFSYTPRRVLTIFQLP